MGDKGETTKKPSLQQQTPQQVSSSSPKDQLQQDQQNQPHNIIISPTSSTPALLPFDHQQQQVVQFDPTATNITNNPKRTRYTTNTNTTSTTTNTPTTTTTTGQWKILPKAQITVLPSATTDQQQVSSSDTSESNPVHHQFRKGKYVSPVWKPNEMLSLARAWRVQYQTGSSRTGGQTGEPVKGKTRADKDREVAEFLKRQGVNRDAKTAGTKWDNMLGEFRKVYEWERGNEREQVGKSYFRLSPYERKLHRLPASFDEEVFEELSQFMGSRLRSSSSSSPQSRSNKELLDQFSLSASARSKQLMIMGSGGGGGGGGSGETAYYGYGGRQSGTLMGFDQTDINIVGPSPPSSSTTGSKELRRIGKVRMAWEESVSLWAEEGENHRGRVKLLSGSLSFLNADELTYFDEAMVASTMEGFEEGPLKGFSVDRFVPGQQVKVIGRKKSLVSSSLPPPANTTTSISAEKVITQQQHQQLPFTEPSIRSIPPWEFQDPSDYYIGCLRVPPPSIPSLFELSWYLLEPPPEELRFPLRKDVYRDLPQGKDLFFAVSAESLDCRAVTYDILTPILRTNPSLTSATAASRDSFIGLWDDCVNRIVSKFCSTEMIMIRKPTSVLTSNGDGDEENDQAVRLQDQWPNVTGFVRDLCLWRGEETDQVREGLMEPSDSIVEKLLWTYSDLPFILGYYAVGFSVTFCALSRSLSQERIVRTDLHTLDLSSPSDRLKALIPCYRIAGLLGLLADRCFINNGSTNNKTPEVIYSDFERFESSIGNLNLITEATPNTVTRFYGNKRKWTAAKEIYDFLDHRIPHAEIMTRSSEINLSLVFKPRGIRSSPTSSEELVEALKCVTKALVALHDLSFMHRDLGWEKVNRRVNERGESEWFVTGFEHAVMSPQIYPHIITSGSHAPEMERGLHAVKVDVWGVGNLVREWFSGNTPASTPAKMLRELQKRCLEQNPEARPTAADCYHHLVQLVNLSV